MRLTITRLAGCIIAGILPLNFIPELPGNRYQLLALGLALLLAGIRRRGALPLALALLASVWAVNAGRTQLQQIERLTRQPLQQVEVKIENLQPDGQRARVRLLRQQGQLLFPPISAMLSLPESDTALCAGQRWLLTVKLRPVHARLNQGGFDAQRYALANGVPLSGRVSAAQVLQSRCGWRDAVMHAAKQRYGDLRWQGTLGALAFGERAEVSADLTQLLRETGTAHLMAISGLHIALAAALGWWLARLLQFGLPAWRIGYRLPLVSSLALALAYCWLSGGNPPAVRAMLALLLWSGLRLSGVSCHALQVWLMCLAVILLSDPLSLLSDSLWLSALAVGGLLLWYHSFPLPRRFRRGKRGLPLRLLHLQLGMLLLMMPLQVLLFHGVSLSAPLANMWAVPLVSLLTVPLILLALLLLPFPWLSTPLWWLADRSLSAVFIPLQQLPHGWLPLDAAQAGYSLVGWLLLMALRFGWWRSSPASLLGLTLSVAVASASVKPQWRVDMLDVGHGLAVVISRHGQATLYDTGGRWPGGDAARSQILPWLRWQGLTVSQIVISHEHLDHIGGLASVRAAFPRASVRSPLGLPGHQPCHRGLAWRWQDLDFQVLWPPPGYVQTGNNRSCVVAVSDGRWRILLTGDIEAAVERALVAGQRESLAATLLQVPHHGSRTSSTPPLLRAVHPDAAIASAARYSAWRLPARQIIRRYADNQIVWRDTALSGQLSARFFTDNWQLLGLREQLLNRWYHQWFGVTR